MEYNTLIVLAGTSLMGVCAGAVGSFAVLRRRERDMHDRVQYN